MHSPSSRRIARKGAVTGVALAVAAVTTLAAPAYAAPPTEWERPDNGSPLDAFLLLGVLPLACILVITLLTYLPSMMHKRGGTELPAYSGGPRETTDERHAHQAPGPGTGHPDSYQGGQRTGDSGGSAAQF
jgi:hypothetical protein